MDRRDFLRTSALAGGALLAGPAGAGSASESPRDGNPPTVAPQTGGSHELPDLTPARWIWYPSGRCLQNTFVLFRRNLPLAAKPRRAVGWICADSRYLLQVNGRRIQWGPAPSDPRWQEADPVELTDLLQAGQNVLAATVLFYGVGDGSWPAGKPGFLFWLDIEHSDGRTERVVSDAAWRAHLARAWQAGHYKRWFLRALQEDFDARRYPYGWTAAEFQPDADWLPAMPLGGSPNQPSIATAFDEYQSNIHADTSQTSLRPRRVPLLRETLVPVKQLTESAWLEWLRPPEEYFDGLDRNLAKC